MLLFREILVTLLAVAWGMSDEIPTCMQEIITEPSRLPGQTYQEIQAPENMKFNYISRFCFSLKACSGAVLVLTPHHRAVGNMGIPIPDSYFILIGGQENTISSITTRGKNVVVAHNRPLSCDHFRRFYVSWARGQVEVGLEIPDPTKPYTVADHPFMIYKDPEPLVVSYAFVGSMDTVATWLIDLPCPKLCVKETVVSTMTDKDTLSLEYGKHQVRYVDIKLTDIGYQQVIEPINVMMKHVSRISFSVKMCDHAGVKLTNTVTSDKAYEFIIGKNNNTLSQLLKDGRPVSSKQHSDGPLDCNQYRKFYLKWDEGKIEAGEEVPSLDRPGTLEDKEFLNYDDPFPIAVNHIFVAGHRNNGTFLIDFPDPKYMLYKMCITTKTETTIRMIRREVEHNLVCGQCDMMPDNKCLCYIVSDGKFTYSEAESFCESGGGHVAILDIIDDYKLIKELLDQQPSAIGNEESKDLWVQAGKTSIQGSRPNIILKSDVPPPEPPMCLAVGENHDNKAVNWKAVECNLKLRAICQIPVKEL